MRYHLSKIGMATAIIGSVVVAVTAMLPPTELRASWTNVRYTPIISQPRPDTSEPSVDAPLVAASWQAREIDPFEDDSGTSLEQAHELRVADDDAAYGDGYAWAADHALISPRRCARLRAMRAEGCRDYVASLAPAETFSVTDTSDEGSPVVPAT